MWPAWDYSHDSQDKKQTWQHEGDEQESDGAEENTDNERKRRTIRMMMTVMTRVMVP